MNFPGLSSVRSFFRAPDAHLRDNQGMVPGRRPWLFAGAGTALALAGCSIGGSNKIYEFPTIKGLIDQGRYKDALLVIKEYTDSSVTKEGQRDFFKADCRQHISPRLQFSLHRLNSILGEEELGKALLPEGEVTKEKPFEKFMSAKWLDLNHSPKPVFTRGTSAVMMAIADNIHKGQSHAALENVLKVTHPDHWHYRTGDGKFSNEDRLAAMLCLSTLIDEQHLESIDELKAKE